MKMVSKKIILAGLLTAVVTVAPQEVGAFSSVALFKNYAQQTIAAAGLFSNKLLNSFFGASAIGPCAEENQQKLVQQVDKSQVSYEKARSTALTIWGLWREKKILTMICAVPGFVHNYFQHVCAGLKVWCVVRKNGCGVCPKRGSCLACQGLAEHLMKTTSIDIEEEKKE